MAYDAGTAGAGTADGGNPFLSFVQRPRIMLLLLAAWSVLGFLTELFQGTGIFVEDARDQGESLELDGALGGLALGWEALPLAVLYLYCFRDPVRYQRVFWLALVHQGSLLAAVLYQWVRGTYSVESVIIPIAVTSALLLLVFVHLFRPRERETAAA